MKFTDAPEPECPRIKDIISEVVQKIQILKTDDPKGIRNGNCHSIYFVSISRKKKIVIKYFRHLDGVQTEDLTDDTKKTEYDQAIRLFKTSN